MERMAMDDPSSEPELGKNFKHLNVQYVYVYVYLAIVQTREKKFSRSHPGSFLIRKIVRVCPYS